jgi:hypothetical protein
LERYYRRDGEAACAAEFASTLFDYFGLDFRLFRLFTITSFSHPSFVALAIPRQAKMKRQIWL